VNVCSHDASYCPHCLGDGTTWEDRFSYETGHYTATKTCRHCEGTGRVACSTCDALAEMPAPSVEFPSDPALDEACIRARSEAIEMMEAAAALAVAS
jgi:hypothetical protein